MLEHGQFIHKNDIIQSPIPQDSVAVRTILASGVEATETPVTNKSERTSGYYREIMLATTATALVFAAGCNLNTEPKQPPVEITPLLTPTNTLVIPITAVNFQQNSTATLPNAEILATNQAFVNTVVAAATETSEAILSGNTQVTISGGIGGAFSAAGTMNSGQEFDNPPKFTFIRGNWDIKSAVIPGGMPRITENGAALAACIINGTCTMPGLENSDLQNIRAASDNINASTNFKGKYGDIDLSTIRQLAGEYPGHISTLGRGFSTLSAYSAKTTNGTEIEIVFAEPDEKYYMPQNGIVKHGNGVAVEWFARNFDYNKPEGLNEGAWIVFAGDDVILEAEGCGNFAVNEVTPQMIPTPGPAQPAENTPVQPNYPTNVPPSGETPNIPNTQPPRPTNTPFVPTAVSTNHDTFNTATPGILNTPEPTGTDVEVEEPKPAPTNEHSGSQLPTATKGKPEAEETATDTS